MLCITEGQKYFSQELIDAIKHGNDNYVRSALQQAKLTDVTDSEGSTLLHYAAWFGNESLAQFLIELKYNVNAQDLLDNTPLMIAIKQGHYSTANVLMEANADIYIRNSLNRNSLQRVLNHMWPIPESTIRIFLNRVKSDCRSNEEISKILYEVNYPLTRLMYLNNPDVTRIMLRMGLPVDTRDPVTGNTALHLAVDMLDGENVKLLLEHGANVSAVNDEGETALFYIQCCHHLHEVGCDILRILMNYGIATNALNNAGQSQLYEIMVYGHSSIIFTLLEYDIDLNAKDINGDTPVHYLACNQSAGVFDALQSKKFDVNARNKRGMTILHQAMKFGNVSSVLFLLKNGADVSAQSNHGHTTLFYAFDDTPNLDRYRRCIELLLCHGADPQHISNSRYTLFNIVIGEGHYLLVRPVLAHLAMLETQGVRLKKRIVKLIRSRQKMNKYFSKCKRQLDKLKAINVHESITLYDILIDSEKKNFYLIKNPRIVRKLIRMSYKCHSKLYYYVVMRENFGKALRIYNLKGKAAEAMCKIFKLNICPKHIVIEKVTDYLKYQDLLNLNKLIQKVED